MNAQKPPPESLNGFEDFLNGSVRKELGLETIDLLPGLEVAKNHLRRGATGEALRMYTALVLCEPMNVDFQVGLANCALAIQEHHLALMSASTIVSLAPADPRGYFLSGQACIGLGQFAEATEDLTKAVELGRQARDATIVNDANVLLQKVAMLQSQPSPT
jgi:Flp pilus assembly protein TadD